jgi:class 3 adenylate cyclase
VAGNQRGSFEPYLPRLVVDWAVQTPGERWREIDGSLVSVDLTGFTALADRLQARGRAGAEELVIAVSGVFEGLIGIMHRRGGDVLKFRGDALLLLFTGDAHPERACRGAAEMQWFIEQTAGTMMSSVGEVMLRMSTGIYSGTSSLLPRRVEPSGTRRRWARRDDHDPARGRRRNGRGPPQPSHRRGARP